MKWEIQLVFCRQIISVCNSKRMIKIGQNLPKLCSNEKWSVFYSQCTYDLHKNKRLLFINAVLCICYRHTVKRNIWTTMIIKRWALQNVKLNAKRQYMYTNQSKYNHSNFHTRHHCQYLVTNLPRQKNIKKKQLVPHT